MTLPNSFPLAVNQTEVEAGGDDLLEFIDDHDDIAPPPLRARKCWRVLIVDDDREVHNATLFALHDILIDGHPLQFLHAHTGAEALDILRHESDIAVALLDVVMENESSGLDLVHVIRSELGLAELRIILRTGQPGYAPEMRVIRDYDINDYKTKSELTRIRLLTTLTTAIRSYEQIHTINASRRGLELIVNSAADLFSQRALRGFAEGVLTQLAALLRLSPEGLLCARDAHPQPGTVGRPLTVVGAAGRYSALIDRPIDEIDDPRIVNDVRRCLTEKRNIYTGDATVLYFSGDDGNNAAVFLATRTPLSETDRQLLEVFCVNIAVGLENVNLFGDLAFLAFSDPLTGLPNRKGFIKAIDEHRQRGEADWTVALIDIDHFSEINDALGHEKGDTLLLAVMRRLRDWLDGTPLEASRATLARVGGDVFGLLAPDRQLDPAALFAQFDAPISVEDYRLPVQVTIGLTRLCADSGDGLNVIKTTNIALKRARNDQHTHWRYYTQDMTTATRARLDLLHDLRAAIVGKRGLTVHYQPQIDLANGRVVGAEALIRWRTDDGRNIPPDQFISLAEYAGLIPDLGEWVLRTAAAQLLRWDAEGLPSLRMAVNVSPVQFRDSRFVSRVREVFDTLGVPARRIELEITEGVAMFDADTVIATLRELRALGAEIAVDDFGTGFSSLSYLQRLPLNRLKIDRSFVSAMTLPDGCGTRIADMVVKLAQALGLSVVAEGVETEAQAALLHNIGCEQAQGYLYARPMDAEGFRAWLHAWPSANG
ncbi:MAG: EAL domain-containing protein [Proteobacteria bacterium]|nr:EAL domain-containing protein [Pseudomonadota bacterium]